MSLSKEKIEYEGIYCERSLYLFHKSNWFRQLLYKIGTNTKFEHIILVLIIFSSLKLVVDTYIFDLPEDDIIVEISNDLDYFFTAAFGLESFIKALAFGLCFEQGSYLREVWNQLDFLIVMVSVIDASFENINLPVIKILRLLRTLRPLRFISHNSGMKTIVVALVQSVGGIFNVAIVVMIVWMMFGILAVNLFGGKLMYCSID
jgi:Ion transport protein